MYKVLQFFVVLTATVIKSLVFWGVHYAALYPRTLLLLQVVAYV